MAKGVLKQDWGVTATDSDWGHMHSVLQRRRGLCGLLTPGTDSKPRVLSSNLDFATDKSDLEKIATNASNLKENPPCPSVLLCMVGFTTTAALHSC